MSCCRAIAKSKDKGWAVSVAQAWSGATPRGGGGVRGMAGGGGLFL